MVKDIQKKSIKFWNIFIFISFYTIFKLEMNLIEIIYLLLCNNMCITDIGGYYLEIYLKDQN